jgi:tRNA 2-selenouridine synthase
MAVVSLNAPEFIRQKALLPILDVRSPGEYAHAHIPGAHSFPLFSDEERAVVGTLYKQRSREAAIKAGLDFFGIKMRRMVEDAERIVSANKNSSREKSILVHCWRGGMRSGAVAWLLDLYGFQVFTLRGGYKAFRHWVLDMLDSPGPIRVLGGYTGSGKTDLLHELSRRGEPVIDLEAMASHKGSAFGAIGQPKQPSQEMFENQLATGIHQVRQDKPEARIWMEDESQRIGTVNLPQPFWQHFRSQPVLFLDIPFEARLSYLVSTYGTLNRGDLAAAITRIQKRLGGLETKTALMHLVEGDLSSAFRILLQYYDKKYGKSLRERENPDALVHVIKAQTVTASENAVLVSNKTSNQPV